MQGLTLSSLGIALVVALAAGVACAVILGTLLKSGLAVRLAIDIPNHRSLHAHPIPRVGGWGIVPVAVVALLLLTPHLWMVAAAAAFLALVSQIDDRRGLPARVRFVAHIAAVSFVLALVPGDSSWWLLAGLGFLMLWFVNLYNFMDGADGLAGGMAVFGFGGYAIAALVSPVPAVGLACTSAAIAGAAGGFLFFNFHPARIFLGDAGSISLGFLAAAIGYWGWQANIWPIWFPAIVFAPFIGDASVTLIRRLLRGEKFWQAHREHYYQRMVQSDFGHIGTALVWYVLMAAGAGIAVTILGRSAVVQFSVIGMWVLALLSVGICIDLRWRRFQANKTFQTNRG
ncbi:UDP-N-acetylmuramyl pentapeptide phosphotransferase/UDP-N-acetylglucosamine-1-phosphate transferase [Paraburkholderia unamae]|uniref:MraY family glycosyltransferase n=1 Tax=Paraburkholderia unamae TaxID=219649 RepID=UPI000DC52D1E|nr:glycosyltransferase family 4 protein [Paraburkholderia unamae]RAR60626.1 UDP-N-acetylmuramyl pentapeptide phosphotransferase/UDP-N-acetylglucosamine-1-phosphate transferase [Paraburkholderia unamae]